VKLLVTGVPIWWVLSSVHWNDCAVGLDGQTVRVLRQEPERLQVLVDGEPRWRPMAEFAETEGQVVNPGVASAVGAMRVSWYVLAAIMFATNLVLMGVRWWRLVRFQRIEASLAQTLRLMFIGHFFNFCLPGSTGGDVLRAYLLTRRTDRRTVAVTTVFLDRFLGLTGLALLALIMSGLAWRHPRAAGVARAVGIVALALLSACLVMFSRRMGRLLRLDWIASKLPRKDNIEVAREALYELPTWPGTVTVVSALTLLIHLALVMGVVCLSRSLGLAVPVQAFLLFVPVIYILAAVPVSIGGLGVVEGMYVLFFGPWAEAGASAVLALALLARITPMLLSVPGFVFWLAGRGGGDLKCAAGASDTMGRNSGPPAPASGRRRGGS